MPSSRDRDRRRGVERVVAARHRQREALDPVGGTPPSSGENQLLRDAATLHGIPGVLIHGRYDVSGPLDTAWQLSQRVEHQ
jgi:hypothetical protein